jgi:hypothetical protein
LGFGIDEDIGIIAKATDSTSTVPNYRDPLKKVGPTFLEHRLAVPVLCKALTGNDQLLSRA